MGQQQLLLLVLSTVIVGLATVAGIQAFSENQAQASQDALTQRGTALASEIAAVQKKPTQLGGIDLTSNNPGGDEIARKLGLDANPFSVEGAGTGGFCQITQSGTTASVECTSADAPQDPVIEYDASAADGEEISTSFDSDVSIDSEGTI
jgi:hypothetical protein